MKTAYFASMGIAVLLVSGIGTLKGLGQRAAERHPDSSSVERGKYLVEEVAKCGECHTPRNADGQLDRQRWLQGAPTWIVPVHPTSEWAERAPAIAGFPAYSDSDAVNIFEKGIGTNGYAIRPPMHIYHLNHEDTTAIVAYLRSLRTLPE